MVTILQVDFPLEGPFGQKMNLNKKLAVFTLSTVTTMRNNI